MMNTATKTLSRDEALKGLEAAIRGRAAEMAAKYPVKPVTKEIQ